MRWRPLVTAALGLFALVGSPGHSGAGAPGGRPVCEVSYTVLERAGDRLSVEVLARNGGAPRLAWQVTWAFAGDEVVGGGWNAEFEQTGREVRASHLAWNGVLAAGGTVGFGFDATARRPAPPVEFRLDGVLCNVPAPDATDDGAPPRPGSVAAPLPPPRALPAPPGRRVVAYLPTWADAIGYRFDAIDFDAVTDIAHFAAVPRPDGSLLTAGPRLPSPALVELAHRRGVRVSLVVGGYGEDRTAAFAALAATPATRRAFAEQVAGFLDRHGYDGVDLDWEFPADAVDRDNLTALVAETRAALGPARSLSLAVPAGPSAARWYDLPALSPYVDWFGVMSYDLYSALWHPRAEHHAPLFSVQPVAGSSTVSVDSARAFYLGRGVPPAKLLVGLPFYGQRYDAASAPGELLANASGGPVDYRDIAPLVGRGWTLERDPVAGVPYLRRDDRPGLFAFDDPTSIAAKCAYVVEHGLGGAIVWHLGQDRLGDAQPLLAAARACRD